MSEGHKNITSASEVDAVKQLTGMIMNPATKQEMANNTPEGVTRPEEIMAMREDAERILSETLDTYQTRFANLPAMQRLRVLWKERRIDETDPVWLMVEALSILDARSQLQFAQVIRIHRAYDDVSKLSMTELRGVLQEALSLRDAIEPLTAQIVKLTEENRQMVAGMASYSVMFPQLLELTAQAIDLHGGANRRAKWELCCMVTGAVIAGIIAGKIFL
jgi:hypothetical protein